MPPALKQKLEQAIFEFNHMPTNDQLQKLDQILHIYTNGNAHLVEGLKLTYMALVSLKSKIRELDQIQQTLGLHNAAEIQEQFERMNMNVETLTAMIFPNDHEMARELVREEYECQPQ